MRSPARRFMRDFSLPGGWWLSTDGRAGAARRSAGRRRSSWPRWPPGSLSRARWRICSCRSSSPVRPTRGAVVSSGSVGACSRAARAILLGAAAGTFLGLHLIITASLTLGYAVSVPDRRPLPGGARLRRRGQCAHGRVALPRRDLLGALAAVELLARRCGLYRVRARALSPRPRAASGDRSHGRRDFLPVAPGARLLRATRVERQPRARLLRHGRLLRSLPDAARVIAGPLGAGGADRCGHRRRGRRRRIAAAPPLPAAGALGRIGPRRCTAARWSGSWPGFSRRP